jgi:hypothetical protein
VFWGFSRTLILAQTADNEMLEWATATCGKLQKWLGAKGRLDSDICWATLNTFQLAKIC